MSNCDQCHQPCQDFLCPCCEYISNHKGYQAGEMDLSPPEDTHEEDKATAAVIIAIEGVEMAIANAFFTIQVEALETELFRLKSQLKGGA